MNSIPFLGPTAIANWAKLNEPWLRRHLALPNGIPGKDTFRRVLGLLNPAAFQRCFGQWLESLKVPGDHESGNKTHSRYVEVEKGHGRMEERRYYQMTAPSYLPGRSEWKSLKTIGAAVRIYEQDGVQKSDTRYYLSSLRRNGKQFANAVRNHWGIENSLHWSLDMTYREDESRVRNRTFAENLSWLRRMTLSLIKQHPGKHSDIMKRRMAGWSVDFLMQILTGKGT